MSATRGVIFDLDGVLIHTDELHFQAWAIIAHRLGIPFTRVDNDRLRGVSRAESLDIILALGGVEMSQAEKDVLSAEKNAIYRESLRSLSPENVEDVVRETLQLLRERGLRLAVGSSSKNAKIILERTGLRPFFDAVSDGENVTRSKPDPEVFLMAAGFLALRPDECVIVEDARAGIDAATAGGFASFGIGDAAQHPDATWSIDKLDELLKHVG